jgi:hypothetical protein
MDPDEEGLVGVILGARQIGAIVVDERNRTTDHPGTIDADGGLQALWHLDSISFRIGFASGIEDMLEQR